MEDGKALGGKNLIDLRGCGWEGAAAIPGSRSTHPASLQRRPRSPHHPPDPVPEREMTGTQDAGQKIPALLEEPHAKQDK